MNNHHPPIKAITLLEITEFDLNADHKLLSVDNSFLPYQTTHSTTATSLANTQNTAVRYTTGLT